MEFPIYLTNGEEFFCIPDYDIILGARPTLHSVEINVYFGSAAIEQILRYQTATKEQFEDALNNCKKVIASRLSDYGFSIT